MVTNWSQKGEMGERAKTVDRESLCGRQIAGAPGGTMLELFLKRIWRFQSMIFQSHAGLEHPRPNASIC